MQIRYFLLLFTACLFFAAPLEAALAAPALPAQTETISAVEHLSREAVEAKLGRKLKFTERIALSVVRGKAKKQARKLAKNGPDGTKVDGLSLASMILGILSIVGLVLVPVAILFAIAALVLGIIGLSNINRNPGYLSGRGYAITGIVLGGGLLFLVMLVVVLFALTFGR